MDRTQILEYSKGMFDFKPAEYQLDFWHSCLNSQRVIGVFCRQSGKSETTSKIAIMLARVIVRAPILIFAPTDRQAGLIAQKVDGTVKKMPYLQHFHLQRKSLREFYFSNGGTIVCETTGDSGETIRGYTAGAIIMEEAGSIKDSIVHTSILPMGAHTDPKIIKIGTPRGMNHFYESSLSDEYVVHQIPADVAVKAGIVREEYVEEMKRTLTDQDFRAEMLAEFIPDSDAYFPYNLIESCVFEEPDSHPQMNNLDSPPKDAGGTYWLGADIARLGQDSTCLIILKKGEPNKVVEIIDIPKSTLDYIIDVIEKLHLKYHFERMYIDETGLGAGVRDVLARKHNPLRADRNITTTKRTFDMADRVAGVRFTLQSKLDIFSNLKVLMEQGLLKFPRNPKLVAQLRDFRYETSESGNVKLHHSEYGHDDYCDALALAAQGPKVGGYVYDL